MLFVDDSLITNVGQELSLKPGQHGTYYRRVILSNREGSVTASCDYLMKVRNGYVHTSKFEGFNLTRFPNQGGVIQAWKLLVRDMQLKYNCHDKVLKEANRHCQFHF